MGSCGHQNQSTKSSPVSLGGDKDQALSAALAAHPSPSHPAPSAWAAPKPPHDLTEALGRIQSQMGVQGLGLMENPLLWRCPRCAQLHLGRHTCKDLPAENPSSFPRDGNSEGKMQQRSEEKSQGHKGEKRLLWVRHTGGKLQDWCRGKKPGVGWGSRAGAVPGCGQRGGLVQFSKTKRQKTKQKPYKKSKLKTPKKAKKSPHLKPARESQVTCTQEWGQDLLTVKGARGDAALMALGAA